MTEAPPNEPAAPPRVLRRSSEGRFLMGICAGLGRYTGIDPVVFRVVFAVLMFGSGIGVFLYIAAFLLMKEPDGRPGYIEQWTHRDFDADTVMALLTGVLACGLVINLASVWLGTGTIVVGMLLAIGLLAAHSNGVDLLALARSMPQRLNRRAPEGLRYAPYHDWQSTLHGQQGPSVPPTGFDPLRQAEPPGRPAAEARPGPAEARPAAAEARPASAEAPAPFAGEAPLGETPVGEAPVGEVPVAAEEPTAPVTAGERRDAPSYGQAAAYGLTMKYGNAEPYESVTGTSAEGTAGYGEEPDYEQPAARAGQAGRPAPRTSAAYSYGEPFAPNGPFQPLDPRRRAGYSPYDPSLYGPPPVVPPRPKRPKSFVGVLTFLLAIIIGVIVVAVQAPSPSGLSPAVVGGALLITIGAGLLLATWWGRGAGLVGLGTVVALMVAVALMVGGIPGKVGSSSWHPMSVAEAATVYDVGVGDGRLDLSDLTLAPGKSVTFNASVSIGELNVIVPPEMRVEVHASNKVGDIRVGQSLRGGVEVRFSTVLEPDVKPDGAVPTIVLNLKGGVGDMVVRHGA
jgi:phage shock protein PspC (stress-responsive transcriptional regulator)